MNIKSVESSIKITTLVLCGFLVLAACSHLPHTMSPTELQHAYYQAIKDAEVAEYNEITRNLVAIVPSNDALRWDRDTGHVLVVTWTAWKGYDELVGSSMKLSREAWVTVVPELKTFCRGRHIQPKQVTLRLEQLLGLPPGSGKTKFVEMWVMPNDLFRPTPDPEVSDHEAELDFPVSQRFVTVSEAHRQWFLDLRQKSYGANGYPWTRLGYTYDWGNRKSEIGLSEFVIRAGALVKVHAVSKAANYCQ